MTSQQTEPWERTPLSLNSGQYHERKFFLKKTRSRCTERRPFIVAHKRGRGGNMTVQSCFDMSKYNAWQRSLLNLLEVVISYFQLLRQSGNIMQAAAQTESMPGRCPVLIRPAFQKEQPGGHCCTFGPWKQGVDPSNKNTSNGLIWTPTQWRCRLTDL